MTRLRPRQPRSLNGSLYDHFARTRGHRGIKQFLLVGARPLKVMDELELLFFRSALSSPVNHGVELYHIGQLVLLKAPQTSKTFDAIPLAKLHACHSLSK